MIGQRKKCFVLTPPCSSLDNFDLEKHGTHIILIIHIIFYQNILPKYSRIYILLIKTWNMNKMTQYMVSRMDHILIQKTIFKIIYIIYIMHDMTTVEKAR